MKAKTESVEIRILNMSLLVFSLLVLITSLTMLAKPAVSSSPAVTLLRNWPVRCHITLPPCFTHST